MHHSNLNIHTYKHIYIYMENGLTWTLTCINGLDLNTCHVYLIAIITQNFIFTFSFQLGVLQNIFNTIDHIG